MYSKIISVASAVSMASLASAALDKPVIEPEFPDGGLDSLSQGLNDNLSPPGNTWKVWDEGWIPEDCKSMIEGTDFSVFDVIPFDINYDDCGDAWVMCRHKDSPLTEQDIVDTFGKIPVRFRSFVRHMLFLPGNAGAGSTGDNVVMNGDLGITVFIHETAHSVDGHGFPDIGGFSESQIWIDAYDADSAVPDSYAQSSQAENFAQQSVVAIYDKVVPDGIGTIQPNFAAIQNQYSAIQTHGEDLIRPDGECASRLENSEPVEMGASAKMRPTTSKPDVSLRKTTKVIKPVPMGDFEIHEFDAQGNVKGTKVHKLRK